MRDRAIFWLKTRGGWKETQVQEITGPPPRMVISWKPMSPEQKERLSRPVPAVEHKVGSNSTLAL